MRLIKLILMGFILCSHFQTTAQTIMVEIGRPDISKYGDARGTHFRMSGYIPVINRLFVGLSYGLKNYKGPEEYYHIQGGVITSLHPINTAYRIENDRTLVYTDKFKRGVQTYGLEEIYTMNNIVVVNSIGITMSYNLIDKTRWNYYIRVIPEFQWHRSIYLSTRIPNADIKFNLEDEMTTEVLYTDKRIKVDQAFGLFIGTGLQYKIFPYLNAGLDFGYDIEYLYPNLVFTFSYTFN